LNCQFSTDKTKAAQALYNQAVGNPHEKIYSRKNVSNRALEVFTQNQEFLECLYLNQKINNTFIFLFSF
jgi:hypothetical protein